MLGWRWAFYSGRSARVVARSVLFFYARTAGDRRLAQSLSPTLRDYTNLFRIPSYALNTAAMTVMTFAIGGLQAWMPDYIFLDRHNEFPASGHLLGNIGLTFGAIRDKAARLLATLFGGWAGDKLREHFASSYFVSGMGMLLCVPATIAVNYVVSRWPG